MSIAPLIANALWAASNLPNWWAFRRALSNPEAAQNAVLGGILHRAGSTAFGRAHQFDQIRSRDDFAQHVPIRDYAEFEPWIERIREGEPNVLTRAPVIRLATTGGTNGPRKLIPYTRSLQVDFNRAVGPWIVDLFRQHPRAMAGSAYWSISPAARQQTEQSAVPIGFEEDSEYLGGIGRRLVDAVMAVPANVRQAASMTQWRERTIHHLTLRRDLRLISVWHPSFLSLLLNELPDAPEKIWPDLQVVSCWGDAHSTLPLDDLKRRLPNAIFQPKGLIATEGIVSIPFQGQWPLAIRSHFFEFLAADGSISPAHTLRNGETYQVLLTTSGGLYRYRLNDRIRVEGRVGRTPSVRFVGKIDSISDRFGEKLSEEFVGEVLRRIMAELGLRWRFAMLAPAGRRYQLYLEGQAPGDLARHLDNELRANTHYAYCRDLGQLGMPSVFAIEGDAWAAYSSSLVATGKRLGEIKPLALHPGDHWDLVFSRAVK